MAKQKTCKAPAIETVNVGAAAVDIGSREHMVNRPEFVGDHQLK